MGGFVLAVASSPSTSCDALCVQSLGGHPPVDRVHAAASLCTCDLCVCVDLMRGVAICRIIVSFVGVYRVAVWFRFVRSALLLAVVTCIVLTFEVMPGLCCFLRATHDLSRRAPFIAVDVVALSCARVLMSARSRSSHV